MKIRHEPPEPFHLFVTGGAGTGNHMLLGLLKSIWNVLCQGAKRCIPVC